MGVLPRRSGHDPDVTPPPAPKPCHSCVCVFAPMGHHTAMHGANKGHPCVSQYRSERDLNRSQNTSRNDRLIRHTSLTASNMREMRATTPDIIMGDPGAKPCLPAPQAAAAQEFEEELSGGEDLPFAGEGGVSRSEMSRTFDRCVERTDTHEHASRCLGGQTHSATPSPVPLSATQACCHCLCEDHSWVPPHRTWGLCQTPALFQKGLGAASQALCNTPTLFQKGLGTASQALCNTPTLYAQGMERTEALLVLCAEQRWCQPDRYPTNLPSHLRLVPPRHHYLSPAARHEHPLPQDYIAPPPTPPHPPSPRPVWRSAALMPHIPRVVHAAPMVQPSLPPCTRVVELTHVRLFDRTRSLILQHSCTLLSYNRRLVRVPPTNPLSPPSCTHHTFALIPKLKEVRVTFQSITRLVRHHTGHRDSTSQPAPFNAPTTTHPNRSPFRGNRSQRSPHPTPTPTRPSHLPPATPTPALSSSQHPHPDPGPPKLGAATVGLGAQPPSRTPDPAHPCRALSPVGPVPRRVRAACGTCAAPTSAPSCLRCCTG